MEPGIAADRAAAFVGLFTDQARFRGWYDQALPVVYGFVLARCAGDADTARDITQEAFVAAVNQRARFEGNADPITWVCAIARNKLMDHFRRVARDERQRLQLVQRDETSDSAAHTAILDRDAIVHALAELPPTQRAVLVLHYLDGMPVREVASTLGRSESAVESLLTRGRDSFRRLYEAGEVD